MPLNVIETLKTRAGHMACNSIFYDWSLSGGAPERLVVKPVDPWPGDAGRGQKLLDAADVGDRTGALWLSDWWEPETADDLWTAHMHGFAWLRDLRAMGTALSKEQGRVMIENWLNTYGHWHAASWRPDIAARRICMWISHYDYFCDDGALEMEERLFSAIVKQTKHLLNAVSVQRGLRKIETIKGILYAGIAVEAQEKWIERGLELLQAACENQVLSDGGHISRSPSVMLDVLECLADMRGALKAADYSVPEFLDAAIENMSAALRLFRHRDRGFALFHSTQEGDAENIDAVLAAAGTRKKTQKTLEQTGFERLEIGRGLVIVDTGKAPGAPYDKFAHAAPLAFEFSYGKNRIFTGCGTHPVSAQWQEALRFTSAHCTACLDHRNACEIKKDGSLGRKATKTTVHREETGNAALLVASHNGYMPLNGVTHARKMYLCDEGGDLRGEDDFACAVGLIKPVEIALRFHLHPDVVCTCVDEGEDLLLRCGDQTWRFFQSGGTLKIEDSLYLGADIEPKKTKQIVLYSLMASDHTAVKWALKKEI